MTSAAVRIERPTPRVDTHSPLLTTCIRLVSTPGGAAGAVIVLLLIGLSVMAPVIAPYPFDELVGRRQEAPSAMHWLGTDELGRDVLSRLLYGARPSLFVGVAAAIAAAVVGTAVGLVAGAKGGLVDDILMRLVDVLLAFPQLILILVLVAALGPSLTSAMVAIALVSAARFARVARAPVLTLVRQDFVTAARVIGARESRILVKHLLPNIVAPVIVLLTLAISGAILAEATLSFLGLGVQPPTPSWGQMLFIGRRVMESSPGLALYPGIAIMVTVLGFNLLGDALRDVLDPRFTQIDQRS